MAIPALHQGVSAGDRLARRPSVGCCIGSTGSVWPRTIVVYTSDQGFLLGDHGWFDKRFMYEESLGMPLIIRYPKRVPAGYVASGFGTNVDYAPTFLELVGAEIPDWTQGRSFAPPLDGQERQD